MKFLNEHIKNTLAESLENMIRIKRFISFVSNKKFDLQVLVVQT